MTDFSEKLIFGFNESKCVTYKNHCVSFFSNTKPHYQQTKIVINFVKRSTLTASSNLFAHMAES